MDTTLKVSRHLVDPELLAMAESFPSVEWSDDTLAAIRAAPPYENGAPDPDVVVTEHHVPVASAPDRRLLILRPMNLAPDAPCLFFVHGGGYVIGAPDDCVMLGTILAKASACVVVLPSYRLAPESRWPAAIDDLYAQFCWVRESATLLQIAPGKIVIGGGSAGGGHAVSLAVRARDQKGPAIAFLLLMCPMLDDRHPSSAYEGEYIWTRQADRYGWESLLGLPTGGDGVPDAAVPGRQKGLGDLPPTYISVGALDLFVESNLDFAKRLIAGGVPTELHVFPGGVHGFEVMAPDAALSKRAIAELTRVLSAAFNTSNRLGSADHIGE